VAGPTAAEVGKGAPGLLIASPQMRDTNFAGTVVLLWHYAEDGAMGVVLNRPAELRIAEVLEQLDLEDPGGREPRRVAWGGPVEPGAGFLLFAGEVPDDEGWNLPGELAVTTSRDRLAQVIRAGTPCVLFLGYAGWAPGQLEAEIATGSWLLIEPDRELILVTDTTDLYQRALASLGLTSDQVWMAPVDE
jgi:putative transcriptional regulator